MTCSPNQESTLPWWPRWAGEGLSSPFFARSAFLCSKYDTAMICNIFLAFHLSWVVQMVGMVSLASKTSIDWGVCFCVCFRFPYSLASILPKRHRSWGRGCYHIFRFVSPSVGCESSLEFSTGDKKKKEESHRVMSHLVYGRQISNKLDYVPKVSYHFSAQGHILLSSGRETGWEFVFFICLCALWLFFFFWFLLRCRCVCVISSFQVQPKKRVWRHAPRVIFGLTLNRWGFLIDMSVGSR